MMLLATSQNLRLNLTLALELKNVIPFIPNRISE